MATFALLPAPARAGTYVVDSCRHADGTPAATDGWSPSGALPVGVTVDDSCGAGGALTLSMTAAGGGAAAHANSPQGLVFRTRQDALIPRSATLWSWAVVPSGGASAGWNWVAMAGDWAYLGGEILRNVPGPAVVGNPTVPLAAANRIDVPGEDLGKGAALSFWLNCTTENFSCPGDGSTSLTRAAVTIEDVAAPQLVGTPTVPGAAGAAVTGTVGVAVQATDEGAGLYRAGLSIDGGEPVMRTFDANAGRCVAAAGSERTFDRRQPCLLAGSTELPWDTTTVPNGVHSVVAVIEDASGNRVSAPALTVTTSNFTVVDPSSPAWVRGAPNGTAADDAAQLRLTWPSTAVSPSTRKADVRRCARPSYREKHRLRCVGRAPQVGLSTRYDAARSDALAGQLLTQAGTPIGGATVELAAVPSATGTAERALGVATTRPDGTFAASVPRRDGSTEIVARYRARLGDTVPVAQARASRTVTASTSIVAPARANRGARVVFSGMLAGRAGRLDGVPIVMQVRVGGRWRTFASAQTAVDGSWRRRLRFATVPGRYPVRARVGTSLGYPYAAGGSAVVTVRVG